jgi:hypothetical protein
MANELTTVSLPGTISLTVKVGHGNLTISTRDALEEATVRLTQRRGGPDLLDQYEVDLRGNNLVVSGPHQNTVTSLIGALRQQRGLVDVAIEVPNGTPMTIASAAEQIDVTGRCGSADIAVGRGRITLDTVDGDLKLRYGSAEATVGSVTGSANVVAGNGSVRLAEIGGSFSGQIGRGDLALIAAHGDVRARAGSGAMHLAAIYGNCDVATGFGPVTIGIPVGVAARVDASTASGQVSSALPLDQAPAPDANTVTVKVRTAKGDITLERATEAAAA